MVGPTGQVDGIDLSSEVIAYAQHHAPDNATFRIAPAEQLPYPDQSFDFCTLAMHHVDPDGRPTALGEMHRLLRPGGTVLIADFRPPPSRLIKHLGGSLGGPAMTNTSIDQVADLAGAAGFRLGDQADRAARLRYLGAFRAHEG